MWLHLETAGDLFISDILKAACSTYRLALHLIFWPQYHFYTIMCELDVFKTCFFSPRLWDGTALGNRCGHPDHDVESFFRMQLPTQTCQWTSTPNSTRWDLATLPESMGGGDLLLLRHAKCLQGIMRADGTFPPVFYMISFSSAGCSLLIFPACCWGERSEKWCTVSGLRQSFLTTRPLRVAEWTRAKYSRRWTNGMAWECVCVQFVHVGRWISVCKLLVGLS